ncbi:MAG: hypothetical protein ACOC6G_02525, partial [Thermoproteota archaeon]
ATFQSFGNATHDSPIVYIRSVNSTVTREIGTEQGNNTRFTLRYLEGFNLTAGETWSQNGPMDISAGPYQDPITQPYFYIQRKDTLEVVTVDGSKWVSNGQTRLFEGGFTAEQQEEICHLFQSYQVIDKVEPPKRMVLKDYEELQRDYEDLQEDYEELHEDYADLQEDYLKLNESHPALLEDYEELASNYTKFKDEYESLNSTYRDLQADYNSLQNTKYELQSDYNSIQENHEGLQSDYESLQSNYTSLQNNYDSLQAKYESTTQSLGTTKTIIYVLIGSTIILSLVLIYLAIKIKREMDGINHEEEQGEISSEGKKVGASREYGELPEER